MQLPKQEVRDLDKRVGPRCYGLQQGENDWMESPFQILWRWVKRMRRGTSFITLIWTWTLVDPPGTRHDRGRMSKSRVPVRERDHAQSRDVSAPVSTPPSLDKKQHTLANAPRTPPLLEHESYFLLLGRLLFLYLCRLSNPHGLTREPLLFLSLEPHQANWSPVRSWRTRRSGGTLRLLVAHMSALSASHCQPERLLMYSQSQWT